MNTNQESKDLYPYPYPCPFCGDTRIVIERIGFSFRCRCPECLSTGSIVPDSGVYKKSCVNAIKKWNERVDSLHPWPDEKPPINNEWYLIVTVWNTFKQAIYADSTFSKWIDDKNCFAEGEITHWMELPAIPRDRV